MKFRSTLSTEENISENLFNAISIYVPKSLALANLSADSYNPTAVTATTYAVIAVTVDNYKSIFSDGSVMLSQWLPVFNDGANSSVTLYIIVFDDTGFTPTITAGSVTWAPLTKAFNELYFISFFKTLFSEHYDGSVVSEGDNQYDDSNYFDEALALSYQCENESTLSFFLMETKVVVFEKGASDTNACKVMSLERGTETSHCTTLVGSTKVDRAEYCWGYLNLIGFSHTEMHVHNGNFMIPIILGSWFAQDNAIGEFVGNKLAKIRLTGTKVKPTGLPSPLNSDVNLNLDSSIYDILDAKYVGYFISISSSSANNAELVRDRSGANFPITAYMISKWIDYNTSQEFANFASALATLTKPVLVNQTTYSNLQGMLTLNIQKFAGIGKLENIVISFPPFSEAKQGQSLKGTAVWSAVYVDDIESVDISGSISF